MNEELQESKNILEKAKSLGVTGSGVDALSGVITSETLGGSETPIQVPDITPSTTAGRISGKTDALLEFDALEQKAAQERADKQAEFQASQEKSQSILERIGITKKEVTEELGEDIPLLKQQRVAARTKLRASQVAELGEIKALDQMPGTLEQKAHRTAHTQTQKHI